MFAAIDIGSNTVLLLIAEYDGEKMQVIHQEQRMPRLGKGVDEHRNLSEEAVDRVISALKDYRRVIEHYYAGVSQIIVTATSAVRDSNNREEFKSQIKQETGFDILILSGREEAQWTYLGAHSMLEAAVSKQLLTLDIGGGSSEISLGRGQELIDYHSFDVGSVRFTERFINSDPPKQQEIENCRQAVGEAFDGHPFSWEGDAEAVGMAGTVTSLAYMEADLSTYDSQKLAGMKMSRKEVGEWISVISAMTAAELVDEYPVVMKGRADVFLAGILVLEVFLDKYGFDDFTVSTGGIRHGAVIQMYQQLTSQEK